MNRVSIAQARNSLTRLIHEVEAGDPAFITRRGKPVAVLLSQATYERLGQGAAKDDCWEAIKRWRSDMDFDWPDLTPDEVRSWRDGSGRAFEWPE